MPNAFHVTCFSPQGAGSSDALCGREGLLGRSMTGKLKLIDQRYLSWLLLALPLVYLLAEKLLGSPPRGRFFYWTGAVSGIFLIATLAITPLTRAWPRAPFKVWLIKQRRYLGVASFLYAAAHTLYWAQQAGIRRVIEKSLHDASVIVAWVSFVILAALFLTSNDISVRKLGPNWKRLQRWAYIAIPLGLLHWFMAVSYNARTIAIYGGAFIVVVVARLAYTRWKRTRAEA